MATPLQIAANRRNAKKSTGPRTVEGKNIVRMNPLKHGLTAEVMVLPHELELDYHVIRGSLIDSYKPVGNHELMLVDQIAGHYWRTIRIRRFETNMFDNQIQTLKKDHGQPTIPNPKLDDMACAVILQITEPESLENYFRYDGTISRDYFRSIHTLERLQENRRRREDRDKRAENAVQKSAQSTEPAAVDSIGFVSQSDDSAS
jgi:hypothetical protein